MIDLRRNQGGDFQRFRALLLPVIEARPAVNRVGGLFVIIGPGTFSAAGVNALDLRNRAHAILAGTAAGIRPNHYGDHAQSSGCPTPAYASLSRPGITGSAPKQMQKLRPRS